MELTVRAVADALSVSEKTIYRWIKGGELPAYRVNDQYRFNRAEILEWAAARKINVAPKLFEEPEAGLPLPSLAESLKAGGIFYRVTGGDRASVLKCVLDMMRLPEGTDANFLLDVLLAREALGSTAIGDGIAIPHARHPIVLAVQRPIVSLSFLEKPIEFGALDGKPVHVLFTLVSPNVRSHLHLLARISYALRNPDFKWTLIRCGIRDEILEHVALVESSLPGASPKTQEETA